MGLLTISFYEGGHHENEGQDPPRPEQDDGTQ